METARLLPIIVPILVALVIWGCLHVALDIRQRRAVRKIQRNWETLQAEARHGEIARNLDLPEPPGDYKWMVTVETDRIILTIITLQDDGDDEPAIYVHRQATMHIVVEAPKEVIDDMVDMVARDLLESLE
jgi:hypothetical protein